MHCSQIVTSLARPCEVLEVEGEQRRAEISPSLRFFLLQARISQLAASPMRFTPELSIKHIYALENFRLSRRRLRPPAPTLPPLSASSSPPRLALLRIQVSKIVEIPNQIRQAVYVKASRLFYDLRRDKTAGMNESNRTENKAKKVNSGMREIEGELLR